MILSEKEEQVLSTLRESEEKLTLTNLSKSIESSLPYTSQLVTILEMKNFLKIERKDKRSKYVVLMTEEERRVKSTTKYKVDPKAVDLAIKLISFFFAHFPDIPENLGKKLISDFTPADKEFMDLYQDRINDYELTWEI